MKNQKEIEKTIKKLAVYDVLLTPIIVEKKSEYKRIGNIIFSPQKYYGYEDPDMSDLAIEFYKIMYNKNEIINTSGKIIDINCAGDTINSFNTLANELNPKYNNRWDNNDNLKIHIDPFQTYLRNQVHCLSNFLLIPLYDGRKSKKHNKFDSVDKYLNDIKTNWEDICAQNSKYLNNIKDFEDFCKLHHVHYNEDNIKKYDEKDYNYLQNKMISFIKNRAEEISDNEDLCEKLYALFNSKNLLDKNITNNNENTNKNTN